LPAFSKLRQTKTSAGFQGTQTRGEGKEDSPGFFFKNGQIRATGPKKKGGGKKVQGKKKGEKKKKKKKKKPGTIKGLSEVLR